MLANFTNEVQQVKLPAQSNLKNVRILAVDLIEKFIVDPDLFFKQVPIKIEGGISLKGFSLCFIE